MSKEVFYVFYNSKDGYIGTFYKDGTYRYDNWNSDNLDSFWKIKDGQLFVKHPASSRGWYQCTHPSEQELINGLNATLAIEKMLND